MSLTACTVDPHADMMSTSSSAAGAQTDVPAQGIATVAPNQGLPDRKAPYVQPALSDLSERLGISVADIVVQAVEEVTWSDTSLGCPQPNSIYEEAPTAGYLVLLTVNGR